MCVCGSDVSIQQSNVLVRFNFLPLWELENYSLNHKLNFMMYMPIRQKLLLEVHLCSTPCVNAGASCLVFQC